MAIFRNEPEEFQRLDWSLLQNGTVTLYLRPEVLEEDVEWLKRHDYRVDSFDCSIWVGPSEMHEALSSGLEFPGYYGRNLSALNDCIGDIEIPFLHFILIGKRFPYNVALCIKSSFHYNWRVAHNMNF